MFVADYVWDRSGEVANNSNVAGYNSFKISNLSFYFARYSILLYFKVTQRSYLFYSVDNWARGSEN